jgi:Flp pilus assembly protein TadD
MSRQVRAAAGARPNATPIGRQTLLFSAIVIVALAFALFGNALTNGYISDDGQIVAASSGLRHPSWAGLRTIWTHDYWVLLDEAGGPKPYGTDRYLYRPFTVTTYLLNEMAIEPAIRAIGADDSPEHADRWRRAGLRSVNVLLHAAAALLIGLWCTRRMGRAAGVVAALVVVAHPVATDVINRLVGRADILVLVGVSGSLAIQDLGNRFGWTWRRTAGAALFAGIALFSKESGMMLLPLWAAQAWIDRRRGDKTGRAWRGTTAILAMTAIYLVARTHVVQVPHYAPDPARDLLQNPLMGQAFADRVPVFFALAWHYVRSLVWPFPLLAFDVPLSTPDWASWQTSAGVLVIAAGSWAAVWAGRRRHSLTIPLAWLAANLLIVGQLIVPIGMYAGLRVMYTMIGPAAIGAGALAVYLARRSAAVRVAATTVGCIVLALAAWAGMHRNRDYRSDLTLLIADIGVRPHNAAAALRLGNAYIGAGRLDEGERYLRLSAAAAPERSEGWYDLGTFLARHRGDYAAALACFNRAIAANPRNLLAFINGSAAAMSLGDLDRAWRLLTRATTLAPGNVQVGYNMAMVLLARGDADGALVRLEAMLRRDRSNSNIRLAIERIRARQPQ